MAEKPKKTGKMSLGVDAVVKRTLEREHETIYFPVLGWGDFRLQYGWKTGKMKKQGFEIACKEILSPKGYSGGCIDLEVATELRNYLTEVIEKYV